MDDIKYDALITIPSYDRYDWLTSLIDKLQKQTTNRHIKIIVHDDASTDDRYLNLQNEYPDVVFIRSEENNGRLGYPYTITKLWKECKPYDADYIIHIDDDFEVCDNFVDLLIKEHENNRKNNTLATNYSNANFGNNKWDLDAYVDGGSLFEYKLIKSLNYELSMKPYPKNSYYGSSGVWKWLSFVIKQNGYDIYMLNYNIITHLGSHDSKMHPEFRTKIPIIIKSDI